MMLTPEQFFGFLSASVLITVSPGPDNLLVLSIGASRGRKLGMAFGLGCGVGCLSHTLLAALLFGLLGYFAGQVGRWLNRNARAGLWLDRIAGAVFVGLGFKLILGF